MVYFVLPPRCFAYRHAATTFYQLQRAFGAGGNMRGSRDFCQSYLVLCLFYSLQRGPMVLLLRKLYLYFTKIQRGSIIFQGGGGGVKLFPGGRGGRPNANFFRNPCTYLLFSRGGPIPLWIRTWAMSS